MSATLTPTEILADTLEALKVQFPLSDMFSTDFSSQTAALNQTITAHIAVKPTVATYDATTGYANGAQEAKDLLADIPVLLDSHKHVTAHIDFLDAIATQKDKYEDAIRTQAFALGEAIFLAAMAKCVAANLTQTVTQAVADCNYDTLRALTKYLNTKGAVPFGRWGIVESAVMSSLVSDSRVASKDYAGQQQAGEAFMTLRNIAGFSQIMEYPGLASTGNRIGVFGDKQAVIIATRVPDKIRSIAATFGIPEIANFETVSDPATGLTLLGISWMSPATFDLNLTMAILYGVTVGTQGGSAGEKTDYNGVRLISA